MDNNEMLSTSVAVWKKMGIMAQKDGRRYIFLVSNSVLNVLQLLFLCFSGEKVEMLILNSFFFVLYFNTVLRAFIVLSDMTKLERFLDNFAQLYDHVLHSGDQVARSILLEISPQGAIFAKLNICLGFFACFCFIIYPLITGEHQLPYGIYVPGLDYHSSPTYEIVYVVQAVITFSGCLLYIPFSNLFVSFAMFGIVLIRVVVHKIRTISESACPSAEENALIERRFKLYIENYKRIIRYVDEVNELVSLVCLTELILFGALLSALLFLVNIVEKTSQLVIGMSYIFLIMVQLFTLYWTSNQLLEESFNIGLALYELPWYHFNERNKKILLMILLRTQKPMQIMIGNVAPITLQMFQSLLNVSYTYYALLRR